MNGQQWRVAISSGMASQKSWAKANLLRSLCRVEIPLINRVLPSAANIIILIKTLFLSYVDGGDQGKKAA